MGNLRVGDGVPDPGESDGRGGASDQFAGASLAFADGTMSLSPVQSGLNLYLPMKSPMQMPALIQTLGAPAVQAAVHSALESLHYVHFARFLPELDGSALWVITVFDGDPTKAGSSEPGTPYEQSLRSYLMDFVATLGGPFNAILDFVKGAPPLPVETYPEEFVQFVINHNVGGAQPWSAYKDMTVIDVQNARKGN